MSARAVKQVPLTYGEDGVTYYVFSGTSTDNKQTAGVATGSWFHEVDTKKVYAFNEDGAEGEQWVEQMTLSEE